VTVRFNLDGYAEVDSAGSVSGAGIGSFKPTPDAPPSPVTLIAPAGTVDAGDAGVRAALERAARDDVDASVREAAARSLGVR